VLRVRVQTDEDRAESPRHAEEVSAVSGGNRDRPLTRADVVALQRTAGNRAVTSLLTATRRRALQRAHTKVRGEKYEYTDDDDVYEGESVWALSDDLVAGIRFNGDLYSIPPADLHSRDVGEPASGNFLFGGITVVSRNEGGTLSSDTTVLNIQIEPQQYEGFTTLHTEPQYFLMMLPTAVEMLRLPSVLAVIIELRQTNTPCAACQKVMGANLSRIEAEIGKPIIVRGSAKRLYQSAPGKLGTALHAGGGGYSVHQEPANVADVHGIHKVL
jgi:hypothetical protein